MVIDNLLSGYMDNVNPRAIFHTCDIRNSTEVMGIFDKYELDGVFHLAAIARTP